MTDVLIHRALVQQFIKENKNPETHQNKLRELCANAVQALNSNLDNEALYCIGFGLELAKVMHRIGSFEDLERGPEIVALLKKMATEVNLVADDNETEF